MTAKVGQSPAAVWGVPCAAHAGAWSAVADPDLVRVFLAEQDGLYAYIAALAGDPAVAEEVFQEVGLSVMREAGRGTVPDDAAAWLRGLARNRVMDHFRIQARRRGRERSFDELAAVIDDAFVERADEPAFDVADVRRLRECLQRLAPRARSLVELRYRRGLDNPGIAKAVGWSVDAVKVALSKARRALGECLARTPESGR